MGNLLDTPIHRLMEQLSTATATKINNLFVFYIYIRCINFYVALVNINLLRNLLGHQQRMISGWTGTALTNLQNFSVMSELPVTQCHGSNSGIFAFLVTRKAKSELEKMTSTIILTMITIDLRKRYCGCFKFA